MAYNGTYFNYEPQASSDLLERQQLDDYQVQNDIKKMSIEQAYAIQQMEKRAALDAKLLAMREGRLSKADIEILMNEGVPPQQVQAMVQHSEAVRSGQITPEQEERSFGAIAGNVVGSGAGLAIGNNFMKNYTLGKAVEKASPYVKQSASVAGSYGKKGVDSILKNAYIQRAKGTATDVAGDMMDNTAFRRTANKAFYTGEAGKVAAKDAFKKMAGSGIAKGAGKLGMGALRLAGSTTPIGLAASIGLGIAGEMLGDKLFGGNDDKEKAKQNFMRMYGGY